MKVHFSIPWHRYALIADLAHRLEGVSPQFGKTVLQKIGYLLQEVYDVPLGYRFTLYNYGPYSAELTSDLEIAESMRAVKVSFVQDGPGGYLIEEGPESGAVRQKGKNFLTENAQAIQKVIDDFGDFTARNLELYTTAILIAKRLAATGEPSNISRVVEIVQALKPYFDSEEIYEAVEELKGQGVVNLEDD